MACRRMFILRSVHPSPTGCSLWVGYGCFLKWCYPQNMDGLFHGRILLKWMIWGYSHPHLGKPPSFHVQSFSSNWDSRGMILHSSRVLPLRNDESSQKLQTMSGSKYRLPAASGVFLLPQSSNMATHEEKTWKS